MSDDALTALRARLEERLESDEKISPIDPRALAKGRWWPADIPWPGSLTAGVIEPRRGYQFRPENLALARCLRATEARSVVDLGAGTGSLLLIAAYFSGASRCVGVERQAEMASRLRRTLDAHGLDAAGVVEDDLRSPTALASIRHILGTETADLIVMNPPFFPAGWGRPSSRASTHASTHALHGDVRDFARVAAALLAPDHGRLWAVFDAARLAALMAAAGEAGLGLRELLWLPQRPDGDATPFRVWACFARGGGARIEQLMFDV